MKKSNTRQISTENTVLDEIDTGSIPVEKIIDTKVLRTVLKGKTVHERK